MELAGKKIIIGVTASIAAYKIPYVIRLLKKQGAEVQVILTPAAHDFVTPLTLATLSERPVLTNFFDEKDGSWSSHIDLGMWADLFLVAPVSANTMAKMATGVADNLLLTSLLSARCPVFFAPAMDLDMFKHPTTTKNVTILESFGYKQIEPASGELASGLSGCGRMEEPENIVKIITDFFLASNFYTGKKVMITAGPTYESIDPVRYIGNHSSGKMGFELARVLAERGAEVDLITGPTNLEIQNERIRVLKVVSAAEMHNACISVFPESDIAIMSAAVADFTPAKVPDHKIKKEEGIKSIDLVPTVDILAELGKKKNTKQVLVGFALETNDEETNAGRKLSNKNLDLIVLNSLKNKGAGFGHDTNMVTIFDKKGNRFDSDLKSKYDIARDIAVQIENYSNE